MLNAPLCVRGTTASPGFARGPLHVLEDTTAVGPRVSGNAASEAGVLQAALMRATAQLTVLMAAADDDDARALLEFQIAMLEDEAIAQAAFAAVANGRPADAAWRATLDDQVRDYRTSGDAYFSARAIDLQDMRDRVLRCITGEPERAAVPAGAIVVAADLAPSRFLEMVWTDGGIALFAGSPHSHVATLARARGIPMIVSMTAADSFPPGDALLDAHGGFLIVAPDSESLRAFDARRAAALAARAADAPFLARRALTADGEDIRVLLNIAHIDDLAAISRTHCDGIGLVRTELLLRDPADLRSEERQFERYRAIVDWAHGLPVTFRTLDAGGDKPIEGYTLADEPNPFLGLRGVRLSLLHPEVLDAQLRALARVAALGAVSIMLPMVTVPDEYDRVRARLAAVVSELQAAGRACRFPALGMMVEVPAAALTIDCFAADFFSIGSNDLIAYLCAAGRDSDRLAALNDPLQPAVLRTIASVTAAARAARRDVSLCGDMASDIRCLPALVEAGIRSISIAPARVGSVKAALAALAGGRTGE